MAHVNLSCLHTHSARPGCRSCRISSRHAGKALDSGRQVAPIHHQVLDGRPCSAADAPAGRPPAQRVSPYATSRPPHHPHHHTYGRSAHVSGSQAERRNRRTRRWLRIANFVARTPRELTDATRFSMRLSRQSASNCTRPLDRSQRHRTRAAIELAIVSSRNSGRRRPPGARRHHKGP